MPWIWSIVSLLIAFLVGIYFERTFAFIVKFARYGGSGLRKRNNGDVDVARVSKVVASLSVITVFAVAVWLIGYLIKQYSPDSIWIDVTSAIFGVTTAALLGGVIFELLLRRELMSEVSMTLANIITVDKQISKEIFSREKRNQIIKTMLQINAGSDLYGNAIFSDFITRFIDPETDQFREFRLAFSDHLKFSPISSEHEGLSERYYQVSERIRYKAELKPNDFSIGCASNEDELYKLFSDPTCLFRWLLKAEDFELLMTRREGFVATLSIDGIVCESLNETGTITGRGFELNFKNPFIEPGASHEMREKIGQFVEFQIDTHALHDRRDRIVSIHLVYPVKGVEITFDYNNTDINDVIVLHFLSPGRPKSRGGGEILDSTTTPIFAPKYKTFFVNIPESKWLFPDSGIIIVW